MTKFILHGGFTRVDNELNNYFFKELVRDVLVGGTLLLVYFARTDEEIDVRFKNDQDLILEQESTKNLNFILANKENFLNQLKESDAILINGGDTNKLLETLKSYPNLKDVLKNKTVAGSSAGAYALSTFYFSNSKDGVLEGLGIAPIRIICHYQSKDPAFSIKNNPLELMENYPKDLELVVLKDFEWKVINI